MLMNEVMGLILSLDKDMFLHRTLPFKELDADIKVTDDESKRFLFEMMYSHNNKMMKKMATILNAVFAQRLQTFMLTRTSCIKLIKEDPNHELSLGTKEYGRLLYFLTNCKMFSVLREPTNNKAGVYQLTYPPLIKELHRLAAADFFKAQEEAVLAFYESEGYKEPKTSSKLKSAKDIIEETNARIASKDIK